MARDSGDTRFLGVYGFSLIVPGVPDYHEKYWPNKGVLAVPGTSDFYQVKGEAELNARAFAYALKYNELLLGAQ